MIEAGISRRTMDREPVMRSSPARLVMVEPYRGSHGRIFDLVESESRLGAGGHHRDIYIRNTEVYSAIRSADESEILHTIAAFAKEKCALGLVLVAGLRTGKEREEAIGQLAKFDEMTLTSAEQAVHLELGSGQPFQIVGTKHTFVLLHEMPELVGRIAVEEQSAVLASRVLFHHITELGLEASMLIIQLLVEKDSWKALDRNAHLLSDEIVIGFGDKIERIAKSRGRHLLPRIGAIHPDESVRKKAIDAIANEGVEPRAAKWCLLDCAEQSTYRDSTGYAIELAVAEINGELEKRPNEPVPSLFHKKIEIYTLKVLVGLEI